MIRLVVAEDQTIIRQGLRRLLDSQPDLQVVGEAENGSSSKFQLKNMRVEQEAVTTAEIA